MRIHLSWRWSQGWSGVFFAPSFTLALKTTRGSAWLKHWRKLFPSICFWGPLPPSLWNQLRIAVFIHVFNWVVVVLIKHTLQHAIENSIYNIQEQHNNYWSPIDWSRQVDSVPVWYHEHTWTDVHGFLQEWQENLKKTNLIVNVCLLQISPSIPCL